MASSGDGKGFQLSYLSSFNPATWINDLLHPQKSSYLLGDIVIPGSHDARMSVLSGVGRRRKRYVNKCNTLTQLLSINK